MAAGGFVLGVAAVLVVTNIRDAGDASSAATAPPATATATPAAVIEPQSVVDANFLRWNTTAFDNIVPATVSKPQNLATPTEEFLYWNISSLEYPPSRYSEQPNGPH